MTQRAKILLALGGLAAYALFTRNSANAAPVPVVRDLKPSGAPVPDPSVVTANQQTSLLSSILSTLRNSTSSSSSSTTGGSSSGATGTGGSTGLSTTPPGVITTRTPGQGVPVPQKGPSFDKVFNNSAPWAANASGGFNSGAFKQVDLIEFFANLADLITGGAGGPPVKVVQQYND
jgi:hypothetical protein